jgi:Rieske Fe-S protein
LIISWYVVAVGAVIAAISASLWIRDSSRGFATPIEHEPETRAAAPAAAAVPADAGGPAMPVMEDVEIERFPRSVFLEGATLGLGALIGGVVTVPVVGFMVAPAFVKQHPKSVDLGPLDDFPEGQYVIATFLRDPAQGEVTRRTAYIRNNGVAEGKPSFTIISNRCAHLGCPVQPNGPVQDNQTKEINLPKGQQVTMIPAIPAGGYGCPCHGGQYDSEGNRVSGPPVRALDRYAFEIVDGHLILGKPFSVSHVKGVGKDALIYKYKLTGPGQHIDGWEQILYPLQPPH